MTSVIWEPRFFMKIKCHVFILPKDLKMTKSGPDRYIYFRNKYYFHFK
jgi:hypothetical protein